MAGLYALLVTAAGERRWPRLAVVACGAALIAVALSAVQWMPAAALVPESARSGVAFSTQTNAALEPKALLTLFLANAFHAASGEYNGPADITQFYYYGGVLAVPLAILGLAGRRLRQWVVGGALVLAPLWFTFGPHTGLYDAMMLLPGFSSVRAPVHMWFAVSLGLSLLGGAGAEWLRARFRMSWLLPAIGVVCFADLCWWNSLNNQLAYAHVSYQQRYGDLEDHLVSAVNGNLPPGTRFHSGIVSASFGPMNGSLARQLEVTYGYNPLPLARYLRYYNTATSNPKLLAGLNAGLVLNAKQGTMERNAAVMPRFVFPANLAPAAGAEALAQHDPAALTLVDGGLAGIAQDATAHVAVVEQGASRVRLRYQARSVSLLRTSIPWFPGWRAGDMPLKIVDHTFLGVVVPGRRRRVHARVPAAVLPRRSVGERPHLARVGRRAGAARLARPAGELGTPRIRRFCRPARPASSPERTRRCRRNRRSHRHRDSRCGSRDARDHSPSRGDARGRWCRCTSGG